MDEDKIKRMQFLEQNLQSIIMIKSDKDKILEELKTQEKLVSSKVNLLSNEEKKFNDQLKEIGNEMIGSIGKKD
jgi:chaperonin cofactor prefoldin